MSKSRVRTFVAVASLCASLLASPIMAADATGVMMKDGKMMMMDGKASGPMDREMSMSDGTKVMTNGMVKMKDGKEMMMMDGQMMDGGKAMEMKK